MHIYNILSTILKGTLWRIQNDYNRVFVTFDDGPNPNTTPFILQTLDNYDVKATFFCVGKNIERYPELFQQIVERGHSVGNHTYSHIKGWACNNIEYFDDIKLAGQYVSSALFRPPYGRIKLSQIKALRQCYMIVFWSVLSYDYVEKITPMECLSNVVPRVKSGDIIVFHDSVKAFPRMSFALPRLLDYLQKNNMICCPIK